MRLPDAWSGTLPHDHRTPGDSSPLLAHGLALGDAVLSRPPPPSAGGDDPFRDPGRDCNSSEGVAALAKYGHVRPDPGGSACEIALADDLDFLERHCQAQDRAHPICSSRMR